MFLIKSFEFYNFQNYFLPQNKCFLSGDILNKIIDVSDIKDNSLIIEIGAGSGALTEQLVKKGKKIIDNMNLKIDDGIDPSKAKNDNKTLTFRSYAAALMYLTSQGWELVSNYNITSGSVGNGYGSTSSSTYWILRKPSTKEEVQKIIDESIKND